MTGVNHNTASKQFATVSNEMEGASSGPSDDTFRCAKDGTNSCVTKLDDSIIIFQKLIVIIHHNPTATQPSPSPRE